MRATDKQRGFTLLEITRFYITGNYGGNCHHWRTRQPGGSQPDGQ